MTQQKTSATQVPSVSVETTNASQLLQCKTYSQKHQQDASDSDIELEIDSQSPSTSVSTGSSTLQSETDKFAAIAAASVAASAAAAAAAAADSNKQQRQQQQQLQHKHQQTNNQIFNTTWDALFDERTMTQTPMSMNNSAIIHVNNGEKKGWTREEKIRKQTQSHMPKMRNRCDYWPACTNKNCKYSHPTAYCRVGDDCSFGDRCSFIHPKDLTEPPKKKNNKSNAGGPKQPLKRTTTGDVLTRPKNNKQSSTLSLK
ncbi:hypothetical protein BD770DRAFT_376634 [Pilaira anomala]|nr:hypothetical protein BD770DRAFT_376634 [Pilaira anomala]